MENPLKILFLTEGIYPLKVGGIERHSLELVRSLLCNGTHVTLVFGNDSYQQNTDLNLVYSELNLEEKFTACLTIVLIDFPRPGKLPGHYIRNSYLFSKRIYERIKCKLSGFDFIYAQGFTAWYFFSQRSLNEKRPKIGVNFHGLNMFQKSFNLHQYLTSLLFRRAVKQNLKGADLVFTFGGVFDTIYARLGVAHKLFYHPVGINSSTIADNIQNHRTPLKFIFIGRNDIVKGLNFYAGAIKKIPENKYEFHFVGAVDPKKMLKRDDCKYHGVLVSDNLKNVLDQCDVLIVPSLSEGMPMVILEAMARGLVIIATNVGAINQIINSENGSLIQPANVNDIVKAIDHYGNMDNGELNLMKKNSLKKCKLFLWEKITKDLINYIIKIK
jgi:glycosyltransferase involved in cell wall biosynthesis